MEIKNKFIMRILAESKNESYIRSCVGAFAVELNPSLSEINDIKTAVSEAVTNSIVHGYDNDSKEFGENYIEVECSIIDNFLEIIVNDKGKGIDNIEQALEPFFTTKPEQERSGMGFAIMKAFMDNILVESNSKGTRVTMVKTIGKEE